MGPPVADLVRADRGAGGVQRGRHADRGADRSEYLCFALGDRLYAAPIGSIREILNPQAITPVPRAPRAILGIMSVRGQLCTVLDLRRCLDLPEGPETRRTRILLMETGTETLGVYVDAVLQVCRLAETDIEEPGPVLGTDVSEHITGIARSEHISSSGWHPVPAAELDAGSSDRASEVATVIILIDLVAALT